MLNYLCFLSIQWIQDGYSNHLNELRKGLIARPSTNKKTFSALGNFGNEDIKFSRTKKKLTEQKSKKSEKSDKEQKEKRSGSSFMKSLRKAGKRGQDIE